MYKLYKGGIENKVCAILRDGKDSIPFALDNTDYQQFKKDVLAGAELQSAEGQAMSQEEANQFVASLP